MGTTTDLTMGLYRRVYSGFLAGRRICSVSRDAECWFWRINAVVDDFGNAMADPILLHHATVGRRADVTAVDVEKWVAELVSAELVVFYEVDGEKYLHVIDFVERQPAGKNGRRIQRFPAPPDESPGTPVNPGESGKVSAPDTHTHTHTHTESGVDGESKNGQPANPDATSQSDARTFAVNWITKECPSFLRSGPAAFVRLICRLGKEEAVRQVQEVMADADVGNPFAYLEAKLDNQRARQKGKAGGARGHPPAANGNGAYGQSVTEVLVKGEA
jgi:hypothetical protein